MRIESGRPFVLLPSIMAIALGVSTVACSGAPESKSVATATMTPTATPQWVIPEVCRTIDIEALRPPILDRISVATYPGNIVVNQAGSFADIAIEVRNLIRINTDPDLGLNSPERLNIIYFFAGSLYSPNAQTQIGAFFEAHRPYLLARYCQEQGVYAGQYLLAALSMRDVQSKVSTANPALIPTSPPWISAIERMLAENYVLGSRVFIERDLNTPVKELSPDALGIALNRGLPFRIARWNLIPSSTF